MRKHISLLIFALILMTVIFQAEARENLSITYDGTSDTVTVSGVLPSMKAGQQVSVGVIKTGNEFLEIADEYYQFDQTETDKYGEFSYSFPIYDAGIYEVSAMGMNLEQPITARFNVFRARDILKVSGLISEVADVSELKSIVLKYYSVIQFDVQLYSLSSDNERDNLFQALFDNRLKLNNMEKIREFIDVTAAMTILNHKNTNEEFITFLEDYSVQLCLSKKAAYQEFDTLETKWKNWMAEKMMAQRPYVKHEKLLGDFSQYVALAEINNIDKWSLLNKMLIKHQQTLSLNLADYLKLDSTQKVDGILVDGSPYSSAPALDTAMVNAINSIEKEKPSGNSTGGRSVNVAGSKAVPVPLEPTRAETVFQDVEQSHWAYESVLFLKGKGVVNGISESMFEPNALVSRAQFAKMLVLGFHLPTENAEADFTDVEKNSWEYAYVASLYQNDITKGKSEGYFAPTDGISRQEAAAFIYRIMQIKKINIENDAQPEQLADLAVIAPYAVEAVETLYFAGVIQGFEDGSFKPEDNVTRAQAAAIISRLIQREGGINE